MHPSDLVPGVGTLSRADENTEELGARQQSVDPPRRHLAVEVSGTLLKQQRTG